LVQTGTERFKRDLRRELLEDWNIHDLTNHSE
jgi:hypothetical protein